MEWITIPRKKRNWHPGQMLHIMNRGANRQVIFHDVRDYRYFLKIMKETKELYNEKDRREIYAILQCKI